MARPGQANRCRMPNGRKINSIHLTFRKLLTQRNSPYIAISFHKRGGTHRIRSLVVCHSPILRFSMVFWVDCMHTKHRLDYAILLVMIFGFAFWNFWCFWGGEGRTETCMHLCTLFIWCPLCLDYIKVMANLIGIKNWFGSAFSPPIVFFYFSL